jgi:molecular chaperone GrpE
MPEPDTILDVDFDSQLQGLFKQAMDTRSAAPTSDLSSEAIAGAVDEDLAQEVSKAAAAGLPQALRPMMLGIEAVTRATGENTTLLERMQKAAVADAEARQDLPKIVADLRGLLETKNGVNQSMFTALHQELKGYKDGFLLQSVYRPIIRDLISLFDDLTEIHRQISEAIDEGETTAEGSPSSLALLERMQTMDTNIEHNVEFILEVLARLQVTPFSTGTGKLDKRAQRALAVEPAANPDEDNVVVRTLKRGFLWQERILRPEEVVIKKWRSNESAAPTPPPADAPAPVSES